MLGNKKANRQDHKEEEGSTLSSIERPLRKERGIVFSPGRHSVLETESRRIFWIPAFTGMTNPPEAAGNTTRTDLKKMQRTDLHVDEDSLFALIVTDEQEIHHVRSRGCVESPVRIRAILKQIGPMRLFTHLKPEHPGL